ncbi:MAG TPA: dihydrolipoamide acyltransferase [Gemmatimonadetes bacterium]|nr:dihydrolipoamide acyltransferase [Gemmatimonadota bacterium]
MEKVPVHVPHMGVVEEVVVIDWLVANGSHVTEGQPLVVIESEKAEIEIEAPGTGTVEVLVSASDELLRVGTLLGNVVSSG